MKLSLLDDGRVDLDALEAWAAKTNYEHLTTFELILLADVKINWKLIAQEVKANPELARLAWGENRTLLYITANDNKFKIVKLLVKSGADVNVLSKHGTPIFGAVCSGNPEIVNYLIKHGAAASFEFPCEGGWLPLTYAARKGYEDIVELLIEAGADVNSIDGDGDTPLDLAAEMSHADVVKLLIKHNAKHLKPETQKYIDSLALEE